MGLLGKLFGRTAADPADELIAWLADKGMDDRRIVAGILYGGPHSQRVLEWLLTRPDCDVGTAAMLLWEFGLPCAVVAGPGPLPLAHEVQRSLIAFIAERWRRGQLAAAVFAYDPREQAKRYRRELAKRGLKGQDPLGIPADAWQPVPGRRPQGTAATGYRSPTGPDLILGRLRLADLAALNPAEW